MHILLLTKTFHEKLIEWKLLPPLVSKKKHSGISTNNFDINSKNIINTFNDKLKSELSNRLINQHNCKKRKSDYKKR